MSHTQLEPIFQTQDEDLAFFFFKFRAFIYLHPNKLLVPCSSPKFSATKAAETSPAPEGVVALWVLPYFYMTLQKGH